MAIQALQPRVKEIQERYKGRDPQEAQVPPIFGAAATALCRTSLFRGPAILISKTSLSHRARGALCMMSRLGNTALAARMCGHAVRHACRLRTHGHEQESDMRTVRAQVEVARLYQEAKVNPLAGCLPTLITLPVWIGLYRALGNVADEGLLTEGFFWIPSLAGPTTLAAQKAVRPPPHKSPCTVSLDLPEVWNPLLAAMPAALLRWLLLLVWSMRRHQCC